MNSNRTKYASTPTYGMQKRNYSKKQAAAQATPTPDFTQQPTVDPSAPMAPFPVQNAFMMPTGAFPGTSAQPANPMFYATPNAMGGQTQGGPQQPSFGAVPSMNPYGGFMPQSQTPTTPMYQQPLNGSSAQPMNAAFSSRAQGYVPQTYPQGGNALPPNVIRGDALGGAGAMPGGGMNAMPNGAYGGMAGNGIPGMGGIGSMAGLNGSAGMGVPTGMNNANGMGGGPFYSNPGYSGAMPGANQNAYGNGGYPPAMMNTPMNTNGFNRSPFPGMEGGLPASPTPRQPFDLDKFLKLMLYGVLPVLFIPCMFVNHSMDFLRYLFIIASVICLSVLWYRQSFTPGVRTTVSVIYLVLCIVVIATMLMNSNRDVTNANGNLSANAAGQTTPEPSASVEAAPLAAQETPAPQEDPGQSEAEQRLSTFMDYWSVNNVESMVNLVQPSWASTQDSPAQALFTVISNRTPTEYQIESISGSATDSSRTVTMSAYIDKNNGKDPVRYRFMILMVKESGEWYVDPNSLATNDTVTETSAPPSGKETIVQSLAPRMTVTPIPDPSTKLYYNANGGTYYHIDPNCSAVNPKYLPMASFLYSELDEAPYSSLQPCLKCGAPTQSLKELEATATPTVAP